MERIKIKTSASYKLIESFIKMNRYTWTVEDVLREYQNKMNGFYVSYTMENIINNNKVAINQLLKEQPKEQHIWHCLNCGARIKALGTVMTKPKECPNCNKKSFD